MLGIAEKRLGETQKAQTHLAEAFPKLTDDRVRIQSGLELLELYYASGDLEKSATIVGALERIAPDNPDVLYSATRIYTDLANQARDTLASVAPQSGRMHEVLAQHLINLGKIDDAILQYQKALERDPKLPGLHYELGEAFLTRSHQAADVSLAEKEFRQALEQNPSDAKSEYQLGIIYQLRGDFTSAKQSYSHAVQLRPNYATAQFALGSVLFSMGDEGAALPHLLSAERLDPSNPAVHYRLLTAYRKLGRSEDAARESTAFQKLWQEQKQIEQTYLDMHEKVPDKYEPDAPTPEADK